MRLRRLTAFVLDWLLLAIWGSALFGIVMFATDGNPTAPSGPWHGQAIAFVAMTLPFTLYFALCERSAWQASLGKRMLGLQVTRSNGQRLTFARSLVRSAFKFLPWELGHVVAQHAAFAESESLPAWLWGFAALSCLLPIWWNGAILLRGAAPYDRWTDSRVAKRLG